MFNWYGLAAVLLFAAPAIADPQPTWLSRVNTYRGQAGVPPVVEDPMLSRGDALHAEYSVKNQVLEHSEDSQNDGYTVAGDRAARESNGAFAKDEIDAVDQWMQAPFHASGILDPRLKTTGFGTYSAGRLMSAWLNVASGMGTYPPGQRFPIVWPGDNTETRLLRHWGEVPEPAESCPGYTLPTGLPLLMLLKPGTQADVSASSLLSTATPGERAVSHPHCVLTAKNIKFQDASLEARARSILGSRGAIIIIPRDPLQLNRTYRVSITVDQGDESETHSWKFVTAH